ncbi:MAG: YHYH protein [Planctomycetota bacterium]
MPTSRYRSVSTRALHAMVLIGVCGTLAHAHPSSEHARQTELAGPAEQGPEQQGRRGRSMEVVDLPEPLVSITIEGEHRVITANGLPEHNTGAFPNAHNPNAMRSMTHHYRIPLNPKIASERTKAGPEFGIALNGVVFDAGTGEFWTQSGRRGRSSWNYDPAAESNQSRFGLDDNSAHVQPTGKYHYHGTPTGLIDRLTDANAPERMTLIGWAFDGFPIYAAFGYADPSDAGSELVELSSSYRLKSGPRPEAPRGPGGDHDGTFAADFEFVEGSGDLDESNGRVGVTPEFPDGTYYYVITDEFPSVPRFWVGTPDTSIRASSAQRPDQSQRQRRPMRRFDDSRKP